MLSQLHNATTLDHDDGSKVEDLFRRAAFSWALSTKRLVESSAALGPNTRVAYAALADIEYARNLLDTLFMPKASKAPAAHADRENLLTAQEIRDSVSNLATRIVTTPLHVVPDQPAESTPQTHRGVDLSAPVRSRNGKMRWAEVDCPACPSKATQRCRKPDGGFIEKPHKARLEVWVK